MSVYSLEKMLVFLHIPKNAGTSIRANLKEAIFDLQDFDTIYNQWRQRTGSKRDSAYANHFPYWRIQRLIRDERLHLPIYDMKVFAVVRNPWERMVSLYRHRVRKLELTHEGKPRQTEADKDMVRRGFDNWLLHTPNEGDRVLTTTAQIRWCCNADSDIITHKIFKIENLRDEYRPYMNSLGIIEHGLNNLNVGFGSKDYRVMYNDKTKAHVEKWFKADIEEFGYEF